VTFPRHEISPAGHSGPDLSVVIVNYRCAEATIAAVSSVLSTGGALRIEVIVVDNGSGDDSPAAIRAAHPAISVADTGHNGGYAWGNNVGIARARGRHVLVLNPDTVVQQGALERAVAYLDANPDIGVLGARAEDETGNPQSTIYRFPRLSHLVWNILVPQRVTARSTRFGDQRYASLSTDGPADVDVVLGFFMLIPRRLIAEIGALDARFFMYSEETEFCWRVRRAGYRVVHHPGIRVIHAGGLTTGGVGPWVLVELSRSLILYFRLTRGRRSAWLATLILFAGSVLRSIWVPGYRRVSTREMREAWAARRRFLRAALFRLPAGQSFPDPASVPISAHAREAKPDLPHAEQNA